MQTKITLLMIVIAVIPTFFLGLEAHRHQEEVVAQNFRIFEGFSSVIKSEITRRIWGYRKLLSTTTQLPSIREMNPHDLKQILERILSDDSVRERGLDGLAVYGLNRKRIATAGSAPKIDEVETIFSDAFFDTYGGEATHPAEPGAPEEFGNVGGLFGGLAPPRTPWHRLKPERVHQLRFVIEGQDGEISGVLVAAMSPEYLSRSINRLIVEIEEVARSVDIYVLDSTDRKIATSRKARYADSASIRPSELKATDPAMGDIVEKQLKSFYTPDWRIILVRRPEAHEYVQKIKLTVRRTILGAVMIAIALGLVLTRTITDPLSKLVQASLKISQGDLSTPVQVNSRDEIGDLAATLEMMRISLGRTQENLRGRIEELATLYDVGKAIGSTLNLQELLNLILDMVMKLVGAEKGSIMLLDEETQELHIAVGKGLDVDVMEKTRVRVGEQVSGYVLETGKPLLIPDSMKSSSFLNLKNTKIEQGALLAVPLITKDKKLGVLNISKSTPYSLGERDLEFFKALSNQAAMAIENARLYEMAIKDEMTKLYVRRYFDQRLKDEFRRWRRYKTPITLILLDIDHFKSFNDTYGHKCGDDVLIFLSAAMKDCMRNVDIVSRYGGEEFAILCPEQALDDSKVPAERLRKRIEESPITLAGHEVNCTISIGVASQPGGGESPEEMYENADKALYHAKNTGRNRVCYFKDLVEKGLDNNLPGKHEERET